MWELDCEESWEPKNGCFWTVVLEKTLESPLDCKEIQLVHSKGDQSWVFFGRNDAEAETPVRWPPHAKSWLIGKDPDVGRDWGQEEKETTEDQKAGWHHRLNGCWVWVNCGSWGWTGLPGVLWFMGSQRVRHDWVTELNWTELSVSMWLKGEWGAEALRNLFSVSSIKGARGLDALWKTLCVLYLSVKSKIQWLWQNM